MERLDSAQKLIDQFQIDHAGLGVILERVPRKYALMYGYRQASEEGSRHTMCISRYDPEQGSREEYIYVGVLNSFDIAEFGELANRILAISGLRTFSSWTNGWGSGRAIISQIYYIAR